MKHKTFEDYLAEKHMEQNPEILDDDLPNSFDTWLTDLQVDDFIAYAEAWGKELVSEFYN